MKRPRWFAPLALLALGACLDAPTAGEVSVELISPNADDGAILFIVHTAAPSELTDATGACQGCQAFVHAVSATEFRVIVTGPLATGPIARLRVANAAPTTAFRVEVREVARRDYQTRSPAGYRLKLVR